MARCFCRHLLTKLAQFLEKVSPPVDSKVLFCSIYPLQSAWRKCNKFCCKLSKYLLHTVTVTRLLTDALHTCALPRWHLLTETHTPTQTELNQWEGTRRNFDAVFNALTHSPDAQESANADTEYPWAPIDPTRTLRHTRWARAQLGPRTSGSAAKVPLRADPLVSPFGVCLRLTVADPVRFARASRGKRSPLIDCVYVAQLARHGMFLRRRHIPVK